MAFSTYLANDTLDDKFTGTTYFALFTDNPTAAGTGTEASGGSYARQALTFNAASGGSIASASAITATVNADTYTHYGIYDALTGGNLLDYGTLNNGILVVVSIDDTDITFDAGDIVVNLDTSL